MRKVLAAALASASVSFACGALAQAASSDMTAPTTPPPPNDYADKANWLCWPGMANNAV